MIQSPIVFLSILFCLFLWQRKAGLLMMDHASLFTEIVHRYLPKLYILIYQSCTLLFTNYRTLLFTDYKGSKKLLFSRAKLQTWLEKSQPNLITMEKQIDEHLHRKLRVRKVQNN